MALLVSYAMSGETVLSIKMQTQPQKPGSSQAASAFWCLKCLQYMAQQFMKTRTLWNY